MSGLMHKVKDALSGEKNTPEAEAANKGNNEYGRGHEGHSTSHGANPTHGGLDQSSTSHNPTHSGRDDLSGRTTDTSGYGSHSTGSATTGPHSSSMGNKADPRVDSDRDGSGLGRGTTGSGLTGSGTHGTHGSSSLERDTMGSGLTGSGTHGSHGTHGSSGLDRTTGGSGLTGGNTAGTDYPSSEYDRTTGGSGLTGSNTSGTGYGSSGYGSTTGGSNTSGPHSSGMMNKADPRVDSDRDGRRGVETGSGSTGHGVGSHTLEHQSHLGDTDIVHGGDHHTTTANRLDPHVSGGRGPIEHATVEGGSSLGGSSGYGSGSGMTSGPHSSGMANKADPRVDSDRDGRRGVETGSGTSGGYGSSTGTTGGYGSTSGTGTGPHSSGMMNKADPRVDSDLDGRRGLETGSGRSGHTGGYGSNTGTTGEYGSSTGGYGSTGGTGYNDNTSSTTGTSGAGPHNSSMSNKLDPRVDSDRDGSRMK